jgi:hypothetical protein
MIVGVIDMGIPDMQSLYFSHPEPGIDAKDRKIGANHRKIVQIRKLPEDVANAHATAMAGCIAGDLPKDNSGKDQFRGGAWAARITYTSLSKFVASTPLKVFGSAASDHARIHSCSFQQTQDFLGVHDNLLVTSYNQDSIDLDTFLFHNSEQIVIVGNPKSDLSTGVSTSKNNVSVTACTKQSPHHNAEIGKTNFTRDGRRKPDLMAVGTDIVTAALTDTDFGLLIPTEVTDDPSKPTQGTSPATAHVAAAAALIRQYFTEGWYPSGKKQQQDQRRNPSGALIKAMLLNATVPTNGTQEYPTSEDGWGRLKLDETLHFEGDKLFLMVQDVPHIFGLKEEHPYINFGFPYNKYHFTVRKNAKLMKITLVFNDPPGPIGQNNLAVNKLDIQVLEPDGKDRKIYLGNDFPELKSREHPASGIFFNFPPDEQELKNNVSQVLVMSPKAGRWDVSVIAHKFDPGRTPIPLDYVLTPGGGLGSGQGYSLVVRVEYE